MSDQIKPSDIEALNEALSVGSSNAAPKDLEKGGVLKVEPLPKWMFNGTPTKVRELSSGKVYKVVMSGYSKELQGTEVTIEKKGQYVDLAPNEYEVVDRVSEKIPGFSMKNFLKKNQNKP